MDCKEVRVDMRIPNPKDREENVRAAQIMFQMNLLRKNIRHF